MAQRLANAGKDINFMTMKNSTLFIIFFISLIVTSMPLSAQRIRNNRGPSLAFGVQAAQPNGQFKQQYDGYPIGIAANFSAPLGRSPLEIGFGYAWNNMGSQTEEVSVLIGQDQDGDNIYENGDLQIRSNTNRFQMMARLRPFNGMIQPYFDGVAGLETYRTKTTIEVVSDFVGYSEGQNADTQLFDMTYSFGWAAGLRIRLAPNIFLDGRFESLIGGPAKYVDQNSIQIADGTEIEFDTRSSRTDKFTYQLGLAASF